MDPLQSKASQEVVDKNHSRQPGVSLAKKSVLLTVLLIAVAATGAAMLLSLGIQDAGQQLLNGLMAVMLGAVGYRVLDRVEQNRLDQDRYPLNDLMRSIAIYGFATAILIVQILLVITTHHLLK